jgi:hypothetical protein
MIQTSKQFSVIPFEGWLAATQTATTQMNRTMEQLCGKAAEDQFEWIKLCLDYSGRQMEACLAFTSPTALLEAETKIASEFSGKLMERWQKDVALMQEAAGEIMTCCKELSILPLQTMPGEEKAAPEKIPMKRPAAVS